MVLWNQRKIQYDAIEMMRGSKKISVKQVAQKTGVAKSTLYGWRKHFDMYGELPSETRNYATRKRHQGRRKFLPADALILKRIAEKEPQLYLDEYQDMLLIRTGKRFNCSTIYRVLINDFGWTLRKANRVAKERDEVDRALYLAMLDSLTDDPSQYCFVDETHKDRNSSRRSRAWKLKNTRNDLSGNCMDSNDIRYTMLGAADIDGFIVEACETVPRKRGSNPDPSAGTVDSERFTDWVRYKLAPTLGNFVRGEPRSIVIMDNAPIHFNPEVEELIRDAGAILIFQPPYSPDLNPIESCFRQYKSSLRRQNRLGNRAQNVANAHNVALLSVSRNNMLRYYRAIGAFGILPPEEEVGGDKDEEDLIVLLAVFIVIIALGI